MSLTVTSKAKVPASRLEMWLPYRFKEARLGTPTNVSVQYSVHYKLFVSDEVLYKVN